MERKFLTYDDKEEMRKIMEEGSCDGYLFNNSLVTMKNLYSKDRFEIVTNLDELSFLNGIYSKEELIDELDSLKEYVSPKIIKDHMRVFLDEIETLRKDLEELDYPVELNPLMSSVKDPKRRRQIYNTLLSMLEHKRMRVRHMASNDTFFIKNIFSASVYPSIYSNLVEDVNVYRENIDGESYFRIKREFHDPLTYKSDVNSIEVLLSVDSSDVNKIIQAAVRAGYRKEHPIVSVIYYLLELEKGKFFNIADTLSPLYLGHDIKINMVPFLNDDNDIDEPSEEEDTSSIEIIIEDRKESLFFTRLYNKEESLGYLIVEERFNHREAHQVRDLKGYLKYSTLCRGVSLENETLERMTSVINIITHGQEDIEFKGMIPKPYDVLDDVTISGLNLYLDVYMNSLSETISISGTDDDNLKIITFPRVTEEGFKYNIKQHSVYTGMMVASPSFFIEYEKFKDSVIYPSVDENVKSLVERIIKVKEDIETKKKEEEK